ncbi:protein CELLULOSE SYNTHASE INTERACTIVE 1-like [Durio zibethinus]|uniref:Protein CELLULOSE SYNTHASE INTERACTIVE 1-like n=1 Tax=Durio zibethinus TaxID=66656 RepID=A0A6P6A2Q7_DURZI|nr:protein CELLULOSE SYNTHASE INTERACTIVE 1-like [Durio zibethinus]XP_022759005.1 protein CELLULOSE SYNTHASE INTERACTIVE 1-like [Durio zibethinus]
MHPTEQPQLPPAPPPSEQPELQPPQTLLDLITGVLSLLLLSSLTVRSFLGRWQVLRSKLCLLQSSLSSISESPHWNENSLLHTLFPSLLSTLQRLKALSDQCTLSSFTGGKLLMQSDLDMASSSLSSHLHDLDLLLRSGILHQSNAIVLSHPGPGSDKDDLEFFIRDLFTRLQIGGIEFKKKALESLIQLLNDDEKSTPVVAKEGNVGYLISLLEVNNQPLIREQAVLAVSVLASSSEDSRKIVFEEGGLGPLLRILETGSIPLKEKAAIAVEAITANSENSWAISAYGGVSILIEACRSGSQPTQTHAVGALRNVASVEDIRMALGEEGAVPVLLQLLVSGTTAAQEKAANCISILASSGEYFRALIVQEKGLPRLMPLIQDLSSSDTIEHILRTISSLSVSDSVSRILSSSTVFIIQLGEFMKHGNMILQQISASLLSKLSISDGNKRAISSCMGSLVKLMESPKPVGLQDAAAQAIVLLLTVRSNRKDLVRDEKSVMRLVQMLDPKNEAVSKKFPLMVVIAVLSGGSDGCRKRLVAVGANKHLQSLAEMEVAGARKALQRLAGNRFKSIFSRTWRE